MLNILLPVYFRFTGARKTNTCEFCDIIFVIRNSCICFSINLVFPLQIDSFHQLIHFFNSDSNARDGHNYRHKSQNNYGNVQSSRSSNPLSGQYSPTAYGGGFSPLDHFGYLAEMSMANGVCASLNKFSGNFLTLRRNCTVQGVTCSAMCWSLHASGAARGGSGFSHGARNVGVGVGLSAGAGGGSWGECVGVVVAELHVSREVAVGARTINLGRGACDRVACLHEYCCCRMRGRIGVL